MEYSEKVMDHFRNPRNMGTIENADGIGKVGNPACGDVMELFVKIENDTITDCKFRTFGCGAAIATSSMVTTMVIGRKLDDLEAITNKTVAEALDGLPPIKMHCSNLAADALKAALRDYYQRRNLAVPENLRAKCADDHCGCD